MPCVGVATPTPAIQRVMFAWLVPQAIDFDRHFNEIYVARVPKDCEAAALAKLSGAGGVQVEPLLSGEWEGEVRREVHPRTSVLIPVQPRFSARLVVGCTSSQTTCAALPQLVLLKSPTLRKRCLGVSHL